MDPFYSMAPFKAQVWGWLDKGTSSNEHYQSYHEHDQIQISLSIILPLAAPRNRRPSTT
jgi:hypothetical protein